MKSTLLTTTALIAFAGAAAAEVSFGADATLGYNDTDSNRLITDDFDNADGFYWDANIAVTLSQELDNGLTAGASFDFDVADNNNGQPLTSGSYVLSLESDTAGLFYGDTLSAAETHWVGAGSMATDLFTEVDGETVIRGDVTFGSTSASISYLTAAADGILVKDAFIGSARANGDVDQLSLGVTAELGQFTVIAAYQEESANLSSFGLYNFLITGGDYNPLETYGLSVGATFGGADITLAYAETDGVGTSMGVEVAYPIANTGLTVGAYYVAEDITGLDDAYGVSADYVQGAIAVNASYEYEGNVEQWAIEGSYDLGNGATVLAGALNGNEADADFYVAGTYDLGGGASVLVSYALDDDASEGDEIGDPEYQEGTTVEVSFTF